MRIVLVILLMLSMGFTKLIIVSNHIDTADTFETNTIVNMGLSGESLYIYYTEDEVVKHTQIRFEDFDMAFEEFKYIMKEMR